MRRIKLTRGKWTEVSNEDYDFISSMKWYAHRSKRGWYAVRNVSLPDGTQTTQQMHRVILGLDPEDPREVDHWDGDGLNNLRGNLRVATAQQNQRGFRQKRQGASSPLRGVDFFKRSGLWRARIKHGEKQVHLGFFAESLDAGRAYDEAARKYFGEFAQPNFP